MHHNQMWNNLVHKKNHKIINIKIIAWNLASMKTQTHGTLPKLKWNRRAIKEKRAEKYISGKT